MKPSSKRNRPVLAIYRDLDETDPYRQALVSAGLEPVLIPAGATEIPPHDGLMLLGGGDVDPALYGERPHPETEQPDPELDAIETQVLKDAVARDLPVLAICRGVQLMNVVFGGTLIQHVEHVARHRVNTADRGLPVHRVIIEPGTLLASIAGKPTWAVNSRHHQAVATVGEGLRVSAVNMADGIIEALERPASRFVLGVQWHPENQVRDPGQLGIFQSFANAINS